MPILDVSTAVPSRPAIEPAGVAGWFTAGDPQTNTGATLPGADWFNDLNGKEAALLAAAAVPLQKGPSGDADWLTAIRLIIAAARREVVFVWEQQATAVNGGTAVTGAWTTRVLNQKSEGSASPIATLASNRVTLPAGTWIVQASSPGNRTNPFKSRLYNHTASATVVVGTSENSVAAVITDAVNVRSVIQGLFTLSVSSELSIQYWASQGAASVSLGQAVGGGEPEIYTQARFERIA